MGIAPQILARQRIRVIRERQTAFNSQLNHIVYQLSAAGGPATDPTPGQWPALWAAFVRLLAITSAPPPPVRK